MSILCKPFAVCNLFIVKQLELYKRCYTNKIKYHYYYCYYISIIITFIIKNKPKALFFAFGDLYCARGVACAFQCFRSPLLA